MLSRFRNSCVISAHLASVPLEATDVTPLLYFGKALNNLVDNTYFMCTLSRHCFRNSLEPTIETNWNILEFDRKLK